MRCKLPTLRQKKWHKIVCFLACVAFYINKSSIIEHTFNSSLRHIGFPVRTSVFLQTTTKGDVIAYWPTNYNQFVKRGYLGLFDFSICTWHKIKFKAIKPEVNVLRENLSLGVQNASWKPQTWRLALSTVTLWPSRSPFGVLTWI